MIRDIHVLHVDDDAAFRDLTGAFLEKVDDSITVYGESDPTQVPERLEAEPIDCVVSDYDMPECDGLELCRRIRAVRPNFPFFLFTNRRSEEIIERAIAAGATDYVQKETGVHHYTLLANRITLAVTCHRALECLDGVDDDIETLSLSENSASLDDSHADAEPTDGRIDRSPNL